MGVVSPKTAIRLAALIEDVEFFLDWNEDPERIAKRLGTSVTALAKKLRANGRGDLAVPFERARKRIYQARKKEGAL